MGIVRIDENLLKEVQKWIKKKGNKYIHPSVSAFVNNAVYEKLKKIKRLKR